jgi:hypothetical protein
MLKPPQVVASILIALKIPGHGCTAASLQELLNNLNKALDKEDKSVVL